MRRRKITIWLMVMVLMVFCLGLPKAQATVVFADGGTHTVNWIIRDDVWVQNSPLSKPTTLNLVIGGGIKNQLDVFNSSRVNISGGSIDWYLIAYNNSQVSISGGSIGRELDVRDYSQANISGGSIGRDLNAWGNSQVNISGGSIDWLLRAFDYSEVDISGGSIIYGDLSAWGNSQVTIYGSGFNYPYGTITGSGLLTGTFPNGEPINIRFGVYESGRIVLVPEPATLLLLGLGVVMGRRRKIYY